MYCFFAGHSYSEEDLEDGYFLLGDTNRRVSIRDLSQYIEGAVERGLKIGIINSCHGGGIAQAMSAVGVPTVIIFGEPVPDEIARKFLSKFLEEFSTGESFYLSFRRARKNLSWREFDTTKEQYPSSTWLPKIYQNYAQPEWIWPTLSPADLCRMASESLRDQDYHDTISNCNRAIELDQNYVDAYYKRGLARKELNEAELALADFQEAADLYQSQDNFEGYQNAQREIRALSPTSAELCQQAWSAYQQALVSQHSDDYDAAISSYTQAIESNQGWNGSPDGYNPAKAYHDRGLCYDCQRDYSNALEDYNRAIETDPRYADAYFHRGMLLKAGNRRGALADFQKAVTLYPRNSEGYQDAQQQIGELRPRLLSQLIQFFQECWHWIDNRRWNKWLFVLIGLIALVSAVAIYYVYPPDVKIQPLSLEQKSKLNESVSGSDERSKSIDELISDYKKARNRPDKLIALLNKLALESDSSVYVIGVAVESYNKDENYNEGENKKGVDDNALRGVAQAQLKQNCDISVDETINAGQELLGSISGPRCKGHQGIAFYINLQEEGKTEYGESDLKNSKTIADDFSKDTSLVGVIGGSNSETTFYTYDHVYDGNKISLISPTSTAIRTRPRNYLFRTAPNDSTAIEELAEFVKRLKDDGKIKHGKVGFMYEGDSIYSKSYIEVAKSIFQNMGTEITTEPQCDVSRQWNSKVCIEELRKQQTEVLLMVPGSTTIDKALEIIQANDEIDNSFMYILGSDTVDNIKYAETQYKKSLEGKEFLIAVPWISEKNNLSKFERSAEVIWGTAGIDWRTVTSYDAVTFLAEAVVQVGQTENSSLSRVKLHNKLKSLNTIEGALGGKIVFDENNDRAVNPLGTLAKFNPTPTENEEYFSKYSKN